MTDRPTVKNYGKMSSLAEIQFLLNANAPDPENVPSVGDHAIFVDASGKPQTARFGEDGWYTVGELRTLPSGDVAVAGAIIAQNSISSFLPGQTAGVPDTASLTVAAGVSQRVALPTGTVFRLDWSGYGPFAFRFGSSSVVAVATDFPGAVGLPQYFERPAGTTHIAVYGVGGGTLVVSGGSQP